MFIVTPQTPHHSQSMISPLSNTTQSYHHINDGEFIPSNKTHQLFTNLQYLEKPQQIDIRLSACWNRQPSSIFTSVIYHN